MKNFTKLVLFFLMAMPFITFSQNEVAENVTYKTFSNSANMDFMEVPTSGDLLRLDNSFSGGKEKCKSYKNMKTAGTILSIVGPVLFVGGIILIVSSVNDDDVLEDDENGGRAVLGVGSMVLGIAATGAGIPLSIIGRIKSKQYCNGKKSSMYSVGAQENGVGVKLVF